MKIGDQAPDFTLLDQNNQEVTLSKLYNKSLVVLFFYPQDNTPICTVEACAFRDSYSDFTALGAQVVGISSDNSESHAKFAEKHNLPFPLLWDKDAKIRKLYGITKTLGLLPGRATFFIDQQGIIKNIFSSQLDAKKHITESLNAINKFKNS